MNRGFLLMSIIQHSGLTVILTFTGWMTKWLSANQTLNQMTLFYSILNLSQMAEDMFFDLWNHFSCEPFQNFPFLINWFNFSLLFMCRSAKLWFTKTWSGQIQSGHSYQPGLSVITFIWDNFNLPSIYIMKSLCLTLPRAQEEYFKISILCLFHLFNSIYIYSTLGRVILL